MKLITLVDLVQVGSQQPTHTKELTAIANQSQQMQKESQYACNHNMAKCRACVCDTRLMLTKGIQYSSFMYAGAQEPWIASPVQ